MATSGVAKGGAGEVDTLYRGYRVDDAAHRHRRADPVPAHDARPRAATGRSIPTSTRRESAESARLADDSLNGVLAHAAEKRLPLQLILNGGIWADATCNTPEWDLNDHLEEDPRNCQWTQDDKVFADDHLKNLAGSVASPELARSLTLNVYAKDVRRYKRRNLQAAARRVAEFARQHPDLFVGVNLDSDTYANPFFEEHEFFDYNPDTLRQFREWLRGDGPYAGRGGAGVPDLRAFRRAKPLVAGRCEPARERELDALGCRRAAAALSRDEAHAGTQRASVRSGTTRGFASGTRFASTSCTCTTTSLRAGRTRPGSRRIGSSLRRASSRPKGSARPFAVRVDSAGQNYDSGGVSIEGAIPRTGHLGAILYGPSASNDRVLMEHRHGLFATFARMDPGWAVVEANMADLKRPEQYPAYAQAYRAFRDLFNYDARQVSLMAWNGSNGIFAGQPGYVSYTSWRNTPAEEAMRDHLVSHAGLPLGSRLWTFGSAQHADDDGWTAEGGSLTTQRSRLVVAPSDRRVVLTSPPDQVIRMRNAASAVVGVDPARVQRIEVWVEAAPGSGWTLMGSSRCGRPRAHAAGVEADPAMAGRAGRTRRSPSGSGSCSRLPMALRQ